MVRDAYNSVIGNYVTLVGPEEYLSHFTKLFVNDVEVEMDEEYTYELTDQGVRLK